MSSQGNIARDISYAQSVNSKSGRAVVRLIENATGRLPLIKRADGYAREIAAGGDFWQVMVKRYGLSLNVIGGTLDDIPREGPVILIANHPYGILDGLMMGHILATVRHDFRILANSVFENAQDLNRDLLPIRFETTKGAVRQNLETRKIALDYLGQGGAIGVFPGGTVSTGVNVFSKPMDPCWRGFTARMVAKSTATVVPLYFDGHTSRLFQMASHVHSTLRLGLLISEFRKRVDTPVDVVIGKPLGRDMLDPMAKDAKAMMDFLRKATYELSPTPYAPCGYGFDFEERHRA